MQTGPSSRYFRYAREHIACDCPLCACPRHTDLYSFVYVDEDRSLIYYDIPKCASSTLRNVLFGNEHAASLRDPLHPLTHYFRFTFVRNPWDRMVSNWKMFTRKPGRIRQLGSMTDQDLSAFDAFVRFAIDHPNHHWQPQVRFLPDPVDFIGRLETFDRDFAVVCDRIGRADRSYEPANALPSAHYSSFYSPETIERVASFYSEDIEAFSYRFEPV